MINGLGWDAFPYFKKLFEQNRLCRDLQLRLCRVSSLAGFEEALKNFQSASGFVCIADESDGLLNLNNTGNARFVKTIFLAFRHPVDDMPARAKAFGYLREIARQFLSRLAKERTRISQGFVYVDQGINFSEIPEAFFSGCACAYFNITVGVYVDLRYKEDEWISDGKN